MLLLILLISWNGRGAYSSWDVFVPDSIQGVVGSCLLIPCSFTYPSNVQTPDGIAPIWYKDRDLKVVYHPTETIEAGFQGRMELLGNPNLNNCTTLLRNLQSSDTGEYFFRFEISNVNRWTGKKAVTVTVNSRPEMPNAVIPRSIREGESVTFQCTTQYYCPNGSGTLEWHGYHPDRSFLARSLQTDTSAVQMGQNLTTSFTWLYHQKQLQCEVSVGDQKETKEVLLVVNHAPKGVKILMAPSRDNIKQGDSVALTCQYNSSYPAVSGYTWYRNNKVFSREPIVSFPSITRQDFGDFRCEVQNPEGTGTSEVSRLIVFSANTLVSPSSEVREGEAVTLTCDVPGADPDQIHYSWYKNSLWIKDGATRSLILYEAAASDAGYYSCKVQNDKGSDSSPPVILHVLYPPRIPKFNSFLETQEGKLSIIHCSVDSNPPSVLTLYKNGQVLATTNSHGAPTQRLNVISSRNSLKLEIREVVMSDAGAYSCVATNAIGNSTACLRLTVEIARLVISPSSEIEEGKEVTLTCFATRSSEKGIKYTWYRNGKWLKETEEDTVTFPRVSSRDAGSYYCLAQSSQGSSSSPPRTLHVFFAPRDLSVSSFVGSSGRNLGIILCTVDSDPHSELFLYRKETLVASSTMLLHNRRYNISTSPNSLKLEIQDVFLEDEGAYRCIANNTYGHMMGSLDFTMETAKISVIPTSEVHEAEAVNLTCILNSVSKGNFIYTWYKNSVLYSEGPEPFLMFQRVSSSDSGSYYCRAWNNATSKSSSSCRLHVFYEPRSMQLKSYLDTEVGKSAFILCTVDSYPPAQMLLYYQDELVISKKNLSNVNQRYRVSFSSNALRVDIQDVKLEDEGKYTCTSVNSVGSTNKTIYFKVQLARILVTPSPEVKENEKVVLTCDLTKTQLEGTMYIWYKNSQRLRESSENTLVFDAVKSNDSGYYHCKAHSSQDSTISPSVSLHVSYAPRVPNMTSFWESHSGQVGIIECNVDSDPLSSLSLYRGKLLVGLTASSQTLNQRMTVSSSQNSLKLVIRDVVLEDEGEYVCTASNSIGHSTSAINFTAQTSRILISPSSQVQEGMTVNLTCLVASNAPGEVEYSWFQNGKEHPRGSSKTLLFGRVSSEDGGLYYCTVRSDKVTKASPTINLNVTYAPRNAYIKSFVETQNGEVAIIQCGVDSNPPSQLLLLKEHQVVASLGDSGLHHQRFNPYFSPNTLRLEIKDLMPTDEGTYIFTAKNVHGTKSVSSHLAVEVARILVNPSPKLNEGQSATLTCNVLSTPQPVTSYTWYKNGRWFQEGFPGSLAFEKVLSADAGTYACTGHTANGTWPSLPITLYVQYPPRNLSLSSFLEAQGKRQGVISCRVESDPPSQLVLYKGGQVAASFVPQSTNKRVRLSSSHNALRLEMEEVAPEDQGEYTCQATNSLGAAQTSVHFSLQEAKVVVTPSAKLQEGGSATLTCQTVSTVAQNASFTWYKNNQWLKDGAEASLLLLKVSDADAGSYHCLAKYGGQESISPLVAVTVLYAPKNLLVTSFLEPHGKDQGIILCKLDSVPPSVITLHREGTVLASTMPAQPDQGQKFWSFSSHNYLRLEIRDVTAEDSGRYVCTANNTIGSTTSSVLFTINDKEVLVYKVTVGVTLLCVVLLLAAIIVMWQRKRIRYTMQTDKNSIEMDNNGTTKEELLS
ncbi:hypothetical protein XENTR_v10000156 [Xenopus tropicalis]|uniref:Sialic acid-binding Ig-like lectin 1 n=1 Tax=Xenopus tropicalis TaxID=8364 RepID=F6SXX7_XENTR|nr:sialoadhesin [Xenopus tropicalis]KAE8628651.1 hypothetical protein XENTR_v10000156 [Xenopus tropicalis]